jgi:hypothetical protein
MAASEGGVQPCSLHGPPASSEDSLDSNTDYSSKTDVLADTPPNTPEMDGLQYEQYLKQIEASCDNLFDITEPEQTEVGDDLGYVLFDK